MEAESIRLSQRTGRSLSARTVSTAQGGKFSVIKTTRGDEPSIHRLALKLNPESQP